MTMYTDLVFANISETADYIDGGDNDIEELHPDEGYQTVNYTNVENSLHNGSVGFVNNTVLHPNKLCPLLFRFVSYSIITGSLCLLGITGNTLSMITLQKDKGNQVANLLLQALALADNALLFVSIVILSVIWGSLSYLEADETFVAISPYVLKYVQPLGYMTKTCAIWMTVLLAVNRYIVIKNPLQAQHICTLWKARLQILVVIIFSIVCNIPRFFSVHITKVGYEETDFGKGSLFHIIYTNVLYTVLVLVLPLILLIFVNVSLVLELKRMRHQRNLMNANNCRSSDTHITLVMCIIIVIFIGCHTPDRILQGVRSFHKNVSWEYYCYLSAVCTLLIIINSSCNFLVYFFLRRRFRRLLYQTVCCVKNRRASDVMATMVSQVGEDTELNGPLWVLRRLSRSLTEILLKNIDSSRNSDKGIDNRNRTRSLGTLLEVHEQHKTHRSHSTGKLLDMSITESDTRLR